MSSSGPSAFGVIGDPDHWGHTYASVDNVIDSRLRGVRRDYNDSSWRSAVAADSRDAQVGKYYAQMLMVTGASNNGFGLVLVGSESTVVSAQVGSVSNSCGMFRGGTIWQNGASVQSGLATVSAGDAMGLALYRESGSLKVQFYKNGATQGTALTLTDGSYRLVASNFFVTHEYFLSVDRDDMPLMPSDCQPWGAAARVSDVGGYSPTATQYSSNHASVTVDAYKRTASGSADFASAFASANTGGSLSSRTDLVYVEWLVDVTSSGTHQLIGLGTSSSDISQYPGAGTDSYGYSKSGHTFNNAASAGPHATYTTGDRVGVIWQPSTGKIWFTKNGAAVTGSPSAGTGASYTATIGAALSPMAAPYPSGRLRLRTHAREQTDRPSYCVAFDGADLLPELYFFDRLLADTEITFEVHYPFPWGGSRRSGSPLGAVNVVNADGKYDALLDYSLRDQELSLYEIMPDAVVPEHFARVLIDSLDFENESRLSIASRGLDALMEVRINEPTFALGQPRQVPFTPVYSIDLTWDLCHTEYFVPQLVYDEGVSLTMGSTTFHSKPSVAQGIRRSISPNGVQVANLIVFRRATQATVANASFVNWTGDNPDSWTTTETGPSAIVTQNGSSARFVRTGGAATLQISQNVSISAVSGARIFIRLNVTAYVSGEMQVGADGGAQTAVGINGTGTYVVPLGTGTGLTSVQIAATTATCDWSLGDVEIWQCTETSSRDAFLTTLLVDFAGIDSTRYALGTPSGDFALTTAHAHYWTDNQPTVRQIVDESMPSWLTDYYTAPNGIITFVQLEDPTGKTTTVTLYETDGIGPVSVRDDLAPALSGSVYYAPNFRPYTDAELAGSVTSSDRALLTPEAALDTINPLDPFYESFADGAPPFRSLINNTAKGELAAVIDATYSRKNIFIDRDFSAVSVRNVLPGTYVTLNADRFSITSKKSFTVRKRRRIKSPTAHLTFWTTA